MEHEARALLALLALQHSDDPHSDEGRIFTELDPSSPELDDICLLAEALRDALAELKVGSAVEARHV